MKDPMKRSLLAAALSIASLACFAAEGRTTTTTTTTTATATSRGMPFHIERVLESFSGVATDVIPVSGYVYVLVDTGAEKRWVVSLKKRVAVGDRIAVHSFGTQKDFESPKLRRVFPQLWFAVISVQ